MCICLKTDDICLTTCMAVQGVEATLFATLMSILNGGSFAGSALGSGLTAAFGVTATNFTLLGPLIAVRVSLLNYPLRIYVLCHTWQASCLAVSGFNCIVPISAFGVTATNFTLLGPLIVVSSPIAISLLVPHALIRC